ncbi:MAG: ParB/RepB/Spo0J family partition protein [candidate division NC10 bacterium]|nr:ParB/RepB/Spo0J family partition protein [candidate division NC10 bacterium]
MTRKALGKGLGALIPEAEEGQVQGIVEIPLEEIRPNRYQPRKRFQEEKLGELATSIKAHGVLAPVILRRAGSGYELIAGERRWRAATMAGLKAVPALVKEASGPAMLELALVENLQREDLNPLEEAEVYRKLTEEFSLTQEEIAHRVGRDRASVANTLRLLRLPEEIKGDVAAGTLSPGHARALLSLEGVSQQIKARERILSQGLSVRAAEDLVRRLKKAKGTTIRPIPRGNPQLRALAEELSRALGTRVRILRRGKKGKLEIEFYSDAELERIYELICGR